MRHYVTKYFIFSFLILLLEACGSEKVDLNPNTGPTTIPALTFTRDISPLITKFCKDCHSSTGMKSGGFYWDRYDQPGSGFSPLNRWKKANDAIQAERMPQTGPLTAQQKATFQDWITAGAPQ